MWEGAGRLVVRSSPEVKEMIRPASQCVQVRTVGQHQQQHDSLPNHTAPRPADVRKGTRSLPWTGGPVSSTSQPGGPSRLQLSSCFNRKRKHGVFVGGSKQRAKCAVFSSSMPGGRAGRGQGGKLEIPARGKCVTDWLFPFLHWQFYTVILACATLPLHVPFQLPPWAQMKFFEFEFEERGSFKANKRSLDETKVFNRRLRDI